MTFGKYFYIYYTSIEDIFGSLWVRGEKNLIDVMFKKLGVRPNLCAICCFKAFNGQRAESEVVQSVTLGLGARSYPSLAKWSLLPPRLALSIQGWNKRVRSHNDSRARHRCCPRLPQGTMGQMQGLISHPLGKKHKENILPELTHSTSF